MKWKPTLLILCLFLLFFIPKVYADLTIVYTANNFQIIIPQGETLTFQHPDISFVVDDYSINVTCITGGINTTNANLRMYQVTGSLHFTSLNTTTYTIGRSREGVNVRIDGVKYFSGNRIFNAGTAYTIEWGAQGADYISVSMGILGLGIIIVTPVLSIYKIKKDKEYIWIVYSLALLTVGGAFVSAWLGAV